MKYIIRRSTQFKRDVKRLLKSGKDIEKLLTPIEVLAEGKALAPEYKDHPLKGQYKGKRDCHIEADWLLIYSVEGDDVILYRTGSHSELFRT